MFVSLHLLFKAKSSLSASTPSLVTLTYSVLSFDKLFLVVMSLRLFFKACNKVFRSLNLVYTPSEGSEDSGASMQVEDPQNVAISFQSVDRYAKEQASTGGAVQKVDRTS